MNNQSSENVIEIEKPKKARKSKPNKKQDNTKSKETRFNWKNPVLALSAVLALVALGALIYLTSSNKTNNLGWVVKFCDGKPCDGSEIWPGSNEEPVTQRTTLPKPTTTSPTTTTTTEPANNSSSTEPPIEPCIYPSCGAPHATYYFPRVIEREVTYAKARDLCTPLQNYEYDLSGVDQANEWFLRNTAKIVLEIRSFGVWIGGHFDLSSDTPYIIRWSDRRRSDALKSPDAIWCQGRHPKYVLPKLIQSRGKSGIVPIVRYRSQSCLTTFDGDVSTSVFFPLCVTKPTQIFLKLDDKIIIPPFYEEIFDKEHLGFVNLNQLYATLPAVIRDTKLALINSQTNVPYMYVAIKQKVPHSYARALCRLVSYRPGSARGSLITDAILDNVDYAKWYAKDIWSQMSRLEPFGVRVALATAGRVDFEEDERQIAYDDDESKWTGGLSIANYMMCYTGMDDELKNGYVQFVEWYKSSGYMTTGPYYVHLAIQARGHHPDYPCFRVESGDLYWPETKESVPLCQSVIE